MPRKPTPAPVSKETPLNALVVQSDIAAANQLAVIHDEAQQRVTELAQKLKYPGSTDPAVLENSARDVLARLDMGIFELGGYLLLLKEACGHGKFLPALERIGLGVDAAGRYMAMTKRFANSATSRNLAALGMSRLVELLPLDDDQLADLTGFGQTGELVLDDVARMSVKEMRAAVRKLRIEKERMKAVNTELNSEVILLKLDKKVVAQTDWPDALIPITDQVAAAGRKLATALSELETCRITLFEKANELGDDERASFEAALGHVSEVYEEALARAERGVERERVTFDKTLGAFSS